MAPVSNSIVRLVFAISLLLATLASAACGGERESLRPVSSSTSHVRTTSSTSAPVIAAAVQGGQLVVAAYKRDTVGVCYWLLPPNTVHVGVNLPACGPPIVGERPLPEALPPRNVGFVVAFSRRATFLFGITSRPVAFIRANLTNGKVVVIQTVPAPPTLHDPVNFYVERLPAGVWPRRLVALSRTAQVLEERHVRAPPR